MLFKRFWQTAIGIAGLGLFMAWFAFLRSNVDGLLMGMAVAFVGIGMLLLAAAKEEVDKSN